MATTKRFLDYAGLSLFWDKILAKFVDKKDAVKYGSLQIADTGNDTETRTITYTDVAGTQTAQIVLPAATENKAGLMSASHYGMLENIKTNIDEMAPFAGLKINDNEVSLTDRNANIILKYEAEGTAETGRKAYISLMDKDYPNGTWTVIDKATYEANMAEPSYYAWTDTKTNETSYYKWSEAGKKGPRNSVGKPIMNKAISRIDVTELLKTGMLISSDVVINPTGQTPGTYLKLVFDTSKDANTPDQDVVYINVNDLVDVYTAGDGITIESTSDENTENDQPKTGKISLKTATDSEVGGIKVGYSGTTARTYAVKLDDNGKAYVAIPWEEMMITAEGDGYITASAQEVSTENNVNTWKISVKAGEGLTKAEQFAKSSIQTVAGDDIYTKATVTSSADYAKAVKVELTDTAEASLGLADSALQDVTAGSNYVVATPVDPTVKGGHKVSVDVSTAVKTSLGLADSAVQTITVLGKELTKANGGILSTAEATKALSLGTAANSNITTDNTLSTTTSSVDGPAGATSPATVPTTAAVKSYVDTEIGKANSNTDSVVSTAIKGLNSNIAAGTTDSVDHEYGAAQTLYKSIFITEGKLDSAKSETYTLKLKDISDFAPLSSTDIDTICSKASI